VGRASAGARLWLTLRRAGSAAAVYRAPGARPAPRGARDRRFFRAAGIRRLIGFHSVPASALYPRDGAGKPTAVEHETTTRLSRLERDGIDIEVESAPSARGLDLPEAIVRTARPWLADRRRHADRRLVAIAPGAKQQTNLWPIERFAEVGRSLLARGDVELVVVGGPAEREAANALLAAWDDGVNATGMLSVLETAAVLRECVLLVGLDTGTTHLAAAVDTPCVALYGGRDNPGRFDPLGDAHRILRHAVPCAGCRIILDPCPLPDHPCMRGIETDEVIAAAMEALA
jgi:ADP-heptose:LPS heptosyltransferase